MPADQIRATRPLIDYVDAADIPLLDFVAIGSESVLDNILVADAWTDLGPEGFILGADFRLGALPPLHLPGLDQVSLVVNPDGFAEGLMVCGPKPLLSFKNLEIALRFDPSILSTLDGKPADIETQCTLQLDRDGFHFIAFDEASLGPARIAGTQVEITLEGIRLGSGDTFLTVNNGKLVLPMFTDARGDPLELTGSNIALGREGPSGEFARAGGGLITLKIYDFTCEIDHANIVLKHGQLVSIDIAGRLDLSGFLAKGREDGWVAVQFAIGPSGVVAALSDDEPIVDMQIKDMFELSVDTIRLEANAAGGNGTLWLSGELTPDIADVDGGWPTFAFDEIGIAPDGKLRLAEGASIATTEPFVLDWNFLRLTVVAFSLERPEGAPDDLELRISASVEVINGIPAGASVEGLVVRRRAVGPVEVRFDGIGLKFGVPGAYSVSASIAWDSGRKALSGTGHLDVEALDVRLDVVFAASSEMVGTQSVTTLFVAAEADLVPGGIPIAATGLSLYSVSGILAHNMALTLPNTGAREYFDAFKATPPGFAALSKWHAEPNAHALGLGVVIGTSDDGWLFSARGALLLSLQDLTLIVTANGDLLKERPALSSTDPAKLAAVLAVHPGIGLLRLDYEAEWKSGDLFELSANGGGEFHVDRPLDFSIWLGQPPDTGKPVAVRAIRLDEQWLLTAQYWFGIDAAHSANIGMQSQVELRAGTSGVYAELVAKANAKAELSWKPDQLEGGIDLSGRARLVGGGLSLAISIAAGVTACIARPRRIEVPLEACIDIDLRFDVLHLCLSYTFAWTDEKPPELENAVQGPNLVPRHWRPRIQAGDHPVDDGIVGHVSDRGSATIDLGLVHPHSELVLECSKSLLVELDVHAPVKLNDVATPLPEPIGKESQWLGQWALDRLELQDRTDGREVDLFGTFSRSPVTREQNGKTFNGRAPNTELRLLSSRRFGQDGSLGGGGAEETPPVDCATKPTKSKKCISLAGLKAGGGRLSNGWPYYWRVGNSAGLRDNRYGVGLGIEDRFEIHPPEGIGSIDLTLFHYQPQHPPTPGTKWVEQTAVQYPYPVVFTNPEALLVELCWEELVAGDRNGTPADWKGSSGDEEWTLAASRRLLVPGHDYELLVSTEGRTLRGTRVVGPRLGAARTYRFRAGRAPDWEDGLSRAIAGVYPSDGLRPAFRDYDLLVHFQDDYFEALYTLDQRTLGVRLRDANGRLVAGPDGRVLLPTRWETGPLSRPPVERWWGKARVADAANRCESGPPPPETAAVVLPIALKDFNLLAETRYSAELIAVDRNAGDANPTEPLARWSFTTSRFADFAALSTPPARIPAVGLVASSVPSDADFAALMRAFGAPAVAIAVETRMTPMRVADALAFVLIEAPEPLDDTAGRLKVTIAGSLAKLIPNIDNTRIVAMLAAPRPLSAPAEMIDVVLDWKAAPSDAPEVRRTVRGIPIDVQQTWRVPLEGLF